LERAAQKEQESLDRAASQERARQSREAAQEEQAPWQVAGPRGVPAEVASPFSVVHVHVHAPASRRSGGVAAVLEVIFALFLGTFGIGHIYAGSVATGLFLMFGWWFFVSVNVVLCCTGIWIPIALVLVPACWFILMLISPLTAASAANYR